MNIFDIIGNFTVAVVNTVTRIVTSLVELVKKKVLFLSNRIKTSNVSSQKLTKQNTSHSVNGTTTQPPIKSSSASRTRMEASKSLFTPTNPVPGQDLLMKEGWTRINVHPVPATGQQVLILKNEKNGTAKMLGKEAFLEYLKELNDKHNR